MNDDARPILVIGGGIAGMTAAAEAAEVGYRVVLVEKEAYLGGRVMRTHRYFPKMCPPTCGFELNARRIRNNSRITVHTLSTVEEVTGTKGDFKVRIKTRPRYVTGRCSLDESVLEKLTSERANEFDYGLTKSKALYMPHDMAWPHTYVLDREALNDADLEVLQGAVPEGAIDFDMGEEECEIEAGAIIVATGWRPYDANLIENLGFGSCANVITNVMMERFAATRGPTEGRFLRPSDGAEAKNVAFVQCAGSRDENHLPYCSAVCCMASLKQVRYLREKDEDAKATMFYIDVRTVGRLEKFFFDMLDDQNFTQVKGKVAKIEEVAASKNLALTVEDTLSGEAMKAEFDLVVLATGMQPSTAEDKLPFDVPYDEYGFVTPEAGANGVFAVGCAVDPCDVSRSTKSSTAAALEAIKCLGRED